MNPFLSLRIIYLCCLFIGYSAFAIETKTDIYSNGYFRSGLGLSEGGSTQSAFQAPGARSKYRLGNEIDTYFEAGIGQIAQVGDADHQINTFFMVDGGAGHASQVSFSDVAQLYVDFKGFLGHGTNAWIGRKYYRRNFVHMLDHAWINPGQGARGGAGVEGIGLGELTLNAAIFQYEDRGVKGIDGGLGKTGTLDSSLLDLRLTGIEFPGHSNLTLLLQGAAQAKNSELDIGSEQGFAVGAWDETAFTDKISNMLFAIYRQGSAVVQGDFNGAPVHRTSDGFSSGGYDVKRAYSWEVNDTVTKDVAGPFCFEVTAGYREEFFGRQGPSGGQSLKWFTVGARPVYYHRPNWATALELGNDHVEDSLNGRTGNLTKLTLAEELHIKTGYFSRPVLRWFATAATWSSEFKGLIGNNKPDGTTEVQSPYAGETFGWTSGFQLETWW